MNLASVTSTASTTPGQRYVLTIINGSVSAVGPRCTYGSAYFVLPAAQKSNTALSVPAGETWTYEFASPTVGFDLNTTSAAVLWSLHAIS